jgi:AbrB family looped-hinge helix DNA binding protein
MPTSTITSKGQITIPKEVRSHLGVAPGDRLDFAIGQDGSVRITLLSRPVRELFGLLGNPGRGPASPEAIADSIQGVVAKEDRRIRRQR